MTDSLSEIRAVSQDLMAADRVANRCAREMGPLLRDLKNARLYARARVLDRDPKMRIPDVDMFVELDEEVISLADREIELTWRLKAAKESAHSLRQILSAWQTTGKIESDLSR